MRLLGLFILFLGVLAAMGECLGLALPTVRWFFTVSREVSFLKISNSEFPWFGWLCSGLLITAGLVMTVRSFTSGPQNPITTRRIKRFREIKRGYYSLIILIALGGLAMLDQAIVGKRALAVSYNGKWSFPAFLPSELKNKDYGVTGPAAEAPADYRKLKRTWKNLEGNRVIMPLIPYDPTGDTLPPRSTQLIERNGIYYEGRNKSPYSGLIAKYYDFAEGTIQLRYTLRKGVISGAVDGWDAAGKPVYSADYKYGCLKGRLSRAGSGCIARREIPSSATDS